MAGQRYIAARYRQNAAACSASCSGLTRILAEAIPLAAVKPLKYCWKEQAILALRRRGHADAAGLGQVGPASPCRTSKHRSRSQPESNGSAKILGRFRPGTRFIRGSAGAIVLGDKGEVSDAVAVASGAA